MRIDLAPRLSPPLARAAASVVLASSLCFGHMGQPGFLQPPAAVASQPLTAEQKLAAEAWRVTDREYVDREFAGQDWFSVRQKMVKRKYEARDLAYDEIRVMLASLGDKYTRFLTPAAYDAVFATATGGVVGIGVELQSEPIQTGKPQTRVLVNNVIPGGPADKAGIMPGDEILNADGEDENLEAILQLPNKKKKPNIDDASNNYELRSVKFLEEFQKERQKIRMEYRKAP
jgi:carboxyl-terminal processing protease